MSTEPDSRRVAELIAAEPAFAALEAAGAPVFAAFIDPFQLVHVNASAGDFLANPETIRRLFNHAWPEKVRRGASTHPGRYPGDPDTGSRLERATLEIGGQGRRVTLLCREFPDEKTGARYFVLAAQGLPPTEKAAPPPASPAHPRDMLRRGASTLRFLWKTDAQDQFVAIDQGMADILGLSSNLVGASLGEVARGLAGGNEWIRAVASRRSWSGVRVEWPLAEDSGVAPVMLGALPATDETGSFAGYNGYGLIHFSQMRANEPSHDSKIDLDPPLGPPANVVPLRPAQAGLQRPALQAPEQTTPSDQTQLTESELSAFEEIARTLGKDDISSPDSRDPPERSGEEDDSAHPLTDAKALALDLVPIGVLVARGAQTLFVNRTLLSEMGYADSATFAKDGGLARILTGRLSMTTGSRADDIDAHVETIDWCGAPATMISLIRAAWTSRAPEHDELHSKLARARSDNAMLRAVIDVLDGAVAILDEYGRIESATTAFAKLLGAEKGDLEGQSLASVIDPEDAPELTARLQRGDAANPQILMLRPRHAGQSLEAILGRLPVGASKLYLRLRPPDAGSDPQLSAAREAAERANRAKSGFLAGISHEIRTPLNAIIGFAEVMIQERFGPVGSPRYRDYLKDILTCGAHVLSLVNDLLDLSKIEAGKMDLVFVAIDANVMIAECMSIMQPQANARRVVMRQALAPTLPTIRADRRALRQILLNLLSNAVKFTPGGGQVIVSSTLTEAGNVLVRVKDTGVGMSEDDVLLALQPFTQIAPVSEARGTGLGLPLTKALVEASGGSLTIRSRPQEGTLVEIAFPAMQIRAAE